MTFRPFLFRYRFISIMFNFCLLRLFIRGNHFSEIFGVRHFSMRKGNFHASSNFYRRINFYRFLISMVTIRILLRRCSNKICLNGYPIVHFTDPRMYYVNVMVRRPMRGRNITVRGFAHFGRVFVYLFQLTYV